MVSLSKSRILWVWEYFSEHPHGRHVRHKRAFKHTLSKILRSLRQALLSVFVFLPNIQCHTGIPCLASTPFERLIFAPLLAPYAMCSNRANMQCKSLPRVTICSLGRLDETSEIRILRRARELPSRPRLILLHALAGSCETNYKDMRQQDHPR